MAAAAELFIQVSSNVSDATRGLAGAQKSVKSFADRVTDAGTKMISTGRRMTFGLTLPLVAMGTAAIKTAADFDKTMNTMGAVAQVPAKDLARLRDLAVEMGAKTIFSANEAGQAMLSLAKGGIKPAQIEAGALTHTLDLAAAGELELADAADVVVRAMKTFGLSGKEAQQAVDALAGAANASSADVDFLATALTQGGQAAAAVGLTVQDTTAILAAFADQGMAKASDAGTSLKTMLLRLVNPTGEAGRLIKELGLNVFDAEGNIKSAVGITREMADAFDGMNKKQRLATMATIFGSDAVRAANALYETGVDAMKGYTKATNDVGIAHRVAAAMMEGLPGLIERLKGSFETFSLTVGGDLKPLFFALAAGAMAVMEAYMALPAPVRSAAVALLALAAAAGPVVMIVGFMTKGFGLLIGLGTSVVASIRGMQAAAALAGIQMGTLSAATNVATGAVSSFGVALKALPWVAVIMGVTEFANRLSNMETSNRNVIDGADLLNRSLEHIGQRMSETSDVVKNSDPLMKAYSARLQGMADAYGETHGPADKLERKIASITGTVADFAGMTGAKFEKWRKETVGGFNLVQGALGRLADKHRVTASEILAAFEKAMKAQLEFGRNWERVVKRAGEGAEGLLKHIQENFGAQAPQIVAALANATDREFKRIVAVYNRARDHAGSTSKAAGLRLQEGFGGGAKKAVDKAAQNLATLPQKIQRLKGPSQAAGNAVGVAMGQGLVAGMNSMMGEVAATAAAVVRAAERAARAEAQSTSPSKLFMKLGEDLVKGLEIGLRRMGRLDSQLEKAIDSLANAVQKRVDQLKKSLEADKITQSAAKGIRSQIDALRSWHREQMRIARALERDLDAAMRRLERIHERAETFSDAIRSGISGFGNILDVDLGEDRIAAAADKLAEARDALVQAVSAEATVDVEGKPAASAATAAAQAAVEAAERELRAAQDAAGPAAIRDFLRAQKVLVEDFAGTLKKLAAKGLNADTLAEIAAGGPQTLSLARSLLQGGEDLIALVNESSAHIKSIGDEVSEILTKWFFGEEMRKAQAAVIALTDQFDAFIESLRKGAERFGLDIDHTLDALAGFVDAVEKAAKAISKAAKVADPDLPESVKRGDRDRARRTASDTRGDTHFHGDVNIRSETGDATEIWSRLRQVARQGI